MSKFISWNVDSLNAALTGESNRALLSKMVLKTIKEEDPDVIAIQETKLGVAGLSKVHMEGLNMYFPGYKYCLVSSNPPARKGYAGVMVLYKEYLNPQVIIPRINAPTTMDDEGRLLVLDFENFYFVNVYTPNAGNELVRLSDRMQWDIKYAEYLSSLDAKKPVIATGDFNVAHTEIDLANPESNHKSPGFTDEERMGFSNLLSRGFIDTFRYLNKDVTGVYTWWAQRVITSKINNTGWRIDYFLVSDRIKDLVKNSCMLDSKERQDHTPIMLEIDMDLK